MMHGFSRSQLARASHKLCFARALVGKRLLQLYGCCGDPIVDDIVDVGTMRLLDLQCQRAQFGTKLRSCDGLKRRVHRNPPARPGPSKNGHR